MRIVALWDASLLVSCSNYALPIDIATATANGVRETTLGWQTCCQAQALQSNGPFRDSVVFAPPHRSKRAAAARTRFSALPRSQLILIQPARRTIGQSFSQLSARALGWVLQDSEPGTAIWLAQNLNRTPGSRALFRVLPGFLSLGTLRLGTNPLEYPNGPSASGLFRTRHMASGHWQHWRTRKELRSSGSQLSTVGAAPARPRWARAHGLGLTGKCVCCGSLSLGACSGLEENPALSPQHAGPFAGGFCSVGAPGPNSFPLDPPGAGRPGGRRKVRCPRWTCSP
jgi:hypothetical protein